MDTYSPQTEAYLVAAVAAIIDRSPGIATYCSELCSECGRRGEDDGDHETFNGIVLIGCEGYWQINPHTLGLPNAPAWHEVDLFTLWAEKYPVGI